ncbi:MAG: histidinol-phosphate transaminase [Planctomycetota bacterium]|nr:histidinol-phosphate transaminase [Planctomycetaceae bacterium]MDQ3332933.1 histidinol-phosphate transaminase [Planctomycetota bacterium]
MSLFRPNVDRIAGYVPGEQPQTGGWIKLNTNENPYPPSPRVAEAIREASQRLNVYPDPVATRLRRIAADLFGVDADWILPGNGSDEVLTILMRTFVDPRESIAFPYPSYVLYETLAALQGAISRRLPLHRDWSFDLKAAEATVAKAKIVFVPNPNSPSGNLWSSDVLKACVPPRGVLVLDGAYADFASGSTGSELLQSEIGERIVLTRTLSKSYSLAGLRFGFAVAHPDLIAGMRKVKDSYNCDSLSIAAACAALADREWLRQNTSKILATRTRLATALAGLGFEVVPSEANFVWATRRSGGHRDLYEGLKRQQILIRYMRFAGAANFSEDVYDGLRITVGTDAEIDRLLDVMKTLV